MKASKKQNISEFEFKFNNNGHTFVCLINDNAACVIAKDDKKQIPIEEINILEVCNKINKGFWKVTKLISTGLEKAVSFPQTLS